MSDEMIELVTVLKLLSTTPSLDVLHKAQALIEKYDLVATEEGTA